VVRTSGLAVSVLALALAGCGGGDDEGTTAAPAEEAISANETTTGTTSISGASTS
jgi:hypothetical protein